jgi:hypothetical protein
MHAPQALPETNPSTLTSEQLKQLESNAAKLLASNAISTEEHELYIDAIRAIYYRTMCAVAVAVHLCR